MFPSLRSAESCSQSRRWTSDRLHKWSPTPAAQLLPSGCSIDSTTASSSFKASQQQQWGGPACSTCTHCCYTTPRTRRRCVFEWERGTQVHPNFWSHPQHPSTNLTPVKTLLRPHLKWSKSVCWTNLHLLHRHHHHPDSSEIWAVRDDSVWNCITVCAGGWHGAVMKPLIRKTCISPHFPQIILIKLFPTSVHSLHAAVGFNEWNAAKTQLIWYVIFFLNVTLQAQHCNYKPSAGL